MAAEVGWGTDDPFGVALDGFFADPAVQDDLTDIFQALDRAESVGSLAWKPFPKQELAWELASKTDELLFGGAAGPGKTEWGLEYCIDQMERFPNNRGLIARRVYPSLVRTIIPRLKRKLKGRAKWNGNEKTFTFPNGSILEIASFQHIDDVTDYQGAEYGIIFFEEITEFDESQWEYMIARLRAPDGCTCRPHAICTSNPGGRGHTWVKRRWVKPKPEDIENDQELPEPTDIWRPRFDEERHDRNVPILSRCFVPATMKDNPALLEKDPMYVARVRSISDKGKRKAFETGDWDAIDQVDGALWTYQGIERGRVVDHIYRHTVSVLERVVAVDPSDGDVEGDGYGVSVCAKGLDQVGYVEASYDWRGVSVQTLARQTIKLYYRVGADCIVIEKNHGGKWLKAVFNQIDPTVPIRLVWASDGKRTRARPISALMEPDRDRPKGREFLARIVGFQPDLEEELTSTIFDGKEDSPNMLDAMVWGLWYLLIKHRQAEATEMQDERLSAR